MEFMRIFALFCISFLLVAITLTGETPSNLVFDIRRVPDSEGSPLDEEGWIQHYNFDGVAAELDRAAHTTFGAGLLEFAGYFPHQLFTGIYREGNQINPVVKITFINGILSAEPDIEKILQELSNTHGGNQIYYVYRPTEGWTIDIYNCILSKLGIVSTQAAVLAQIWRELIVEMGGPNGGGTIVHYAHSVGGTDSFIAGCLLTKEEQKMIHVFTFGSPTLIPTNSGFASTSNYVSVRDGVPLWDIFRQIIRLTTGDGNIHYVGTLRGMWFVDHPFMSEAYLNVVQKLGQEFLQKYN